VAFGIDYLEAISLFHQCLEEGGTVRTATPMSSYFVLVGVIAELPVAGSAKKHSGARKGQDGRRVRGFSFAVYGGLHRC
jgi:hypothetical protein